MRQLIAGNWKMNATMAEAARIAGPLRDAAGLSCDLVVCPPTTVLMAVAGLLGGSRVEVGGQDCHAAPAGAHTGDISAAMLRDAGALWVILGHSERRGGHGETDALIRAKTTAALAAGLRPIVCVGETQEEHDSNRAMEVVERQVRLSLPPGFVGTLAYEPIWAIGSGRVADEADVTKVHSCIRAIVGPDVRILYGGSVRPENAARLLALPNVDGALVGGASLHPEAFLAIAAASLADAARLEPAAEAGIS